MSLINDGKKSEKIIVKYFEENYGKDVFIYRIADQRELSKGGKVKNVSARATPADFIITIQGNMAYLEIKSTVKNTLNILSTFTKSQISAMTRQIEAEGDYLIYIHQTLENLWYLINGEDVVDALAKGEKSIKLEKCIKLR